MTSEIVFYSLIGLFIAHELDAVRLREWQLLFVLRHQPDHLAYKNFVLLHVPILVLVLWLNAHPSVQVRLWFRGALDAFALIHLGLHWHLRDRVQAGFQDPFSRALIVAFGLIGIIDFSLMMTARFQ